LDDVIQPGTPRCVAGMELRDSRSLVLQEPAKVRLCYTGLGPTAIDAIGKADRCAEARAAV
jgi:hypothetical protein